MKIYTKKYMAEYGIENVRGAAYSKLDLSEAEIALLKKEICSANDAFAVSERAISQKIAEKRFTAVALEFMKKNMKQTMKRRKHLM